MLRFYIILFLKTCNYSNIVSGAPLSVARIPPITDKLFFLIVETNALILQKVPMCFF